MDNNAYFGGFPNDIPYGYQSAQSEFGNIDRDYHYDKRPMTDVDRDLGSALRYERSHSVECYDDRSLRDDDGLFPTRIEYHHGFQVQPQGFSADQPGLLPPPLTSREDNWDAHRLPAPEPASRWGLLPPPEPASRWNSFTPAGSSGSNRWSSEPPNGQQQHNYLLPAPAGIQEQHRSFPQEHVSYRRSPPVALSEHHQSVADFDHSNHQSYNKILLPSPSEFKDYHRGMSPGPTEQRSYHKGLLPSPSEYDGSRRGLSPDNSEHVRSHKRHKLSPSPSERYLPAPTSERQTTVATSSASTSGRTASSSHPSERWRHDDPTLTIFLGGMPRSIEEDNIRVHLEEDGVVFRDIRMVRHKDTGANRGFAFVEFHSIDDAQRWMELNQGHLRIRDSQSVVRVLNMDYSRAPNPVKTTETPKPAPPPVEKHTSASRQKDPDDDWVCKSCGCHNFRRRERCFRCNSYRNDSVSSHVEPSEDGSHLVGSTPCNTLLLRGLDALTTEDKLVSSLSLVADVRLKNVHVVRHATTNSSRGFALVELPSTLDCTLLLGIITRSHEPLEVDGKALVASYASDNFNYLMSELSQHQPHLYTVTTRDRQESSTAITTQQDSNGSVEQSASNVAAPDINTFVFDDSSGYYYDATTGYYYDANTQYFYNTVASQFLYWDSVARCYQPVSTDSTSNTTTTTTTTTVDSTTTTATDTNSADNKSAAEPILTQDDKLKKEKALQAKKIAKEMERWAKVQNTHKESNSSSGGFKKPLAPVPVSAKSKETATADIGFAVLSKSKSTKSDIFTIDFLRSKDRKNASKLKTMKAMKSAPAAGSGPAAESGPLGLVASYGSDTESDEEPEEPVEPPRPAAPAEQWNAAAVEEKMTDWDKLTCLLCKRFFNTRDILRKHQQISDLHKANLEELRLKSLKGQR